MRLSSAAFNLARLHVTCATNGGRPPSLFFPLSKSLSLGARRFVGMAARKKSMMAFGDAPSSGSLYFPIDRTLGLYIAIFGLYFAIASNLHRELDRVESKLDGVETKITTMLESKIKEVTTMLESKLDGQDRKLAGQDHKLAGQDRKVDGIGQIVALLPLKFEIKKYWSWFGRSASSVESEERNVSDIVAKVIVNLDAKVDTMITDKLDSKFDAVVDAKFDAKLKELKDVTVGQDRVNDTNGTKK